MSPVAPGLEAEKLLGSLVRISPVEIHIDDPEFFNEIYAQSPALDKLKSHEHRFDLPYAAFSTADSGLHKMRRAALNPFLSKQRIQSHEPLIKSKLNRVCERLTNEYAGNGRILVLNDLFGCLTANVVMEIAFGQSDNLIESEDFLHPFTLAAAATVRMVHLTTHFPWIVTLSKLIPEDILIALSPLLRPVILFRRVR